MLPEDLGVILTHCGQEMKYRGGGVHWKGIVEYSHGNFTCDYCGIKVVLNCEDLSPLPAGST